MKDDAVSNDFLRARQNIRDVMSIESLGIKTNGLSWMKDPERRSMGWYYLGSDHNIYTREEINYIMGEIMKDFICNASYTMQPSMKNKYEVDDFLKIVNSALKDLKQEKIKIKIRETGYRDKNYLFHFYYDDCLINNLFVLYEVSSNEVHNDRPDISDDEVDFLKNISWYINNVPERLINDLFDLLNDTLKRDHIYETDSNELYIIK